MKRYYKYGCVALVLIYAVSAVGVAVHSCHCEYSNSIMWISGNDCECAEQHMPHGHRGNCCDHHSIPQQNMECCIHAVADESTVQKDNTDGKCCNTVVKALQTDQNISNFSSKIFTELFMLLTSRQPAFIMLVCAVDNIAAISHQMPLSRNGWYLQFLGQWRL